MVRDRARLAWAENRRARSTCIESPDSYDYGAYKWTVQLVTNDSRLEKILFPIFWGLMTLRFSLSSLLSSLKFSFQDLNFSLILPTFLCVC